MLFSKKGAYIGIKFNIVVPKTANIRITCVGQYRLFADSGEVQVQKNVSKGAEHHEDCIAEIKKIKIKKICKLKTEHNL